MKKVALFIIELYQKWVSPMVGQRCRFYPSCSNYSKEAFMRHGGIKALYLSCKRVLRCQPLSRGGFDPVPLAEE